MGIFINGLYNKWCHLIASSMERVLQLLKTCGWKTLWNRNHEEPIIAWWLTRYKVDGWWTNCTAECLVVIWVWNTHTGTHHSQPLVGWWERTRKSTSTLAHHAIHTAMGTTTGTTPIHNHTVWVHWNWFDGWTTITKSQSWSGGD